MTTEIDGISGRVSGLPHSFLFLDCSSIPWHSLPSGARGSSSTRWQFQSHRICAVLAPHCVRYTFPSRAPSPPAATSHVLDVAHSRNDLFNYTSGRRMYNKSQTCCARDLTTTLFATKGAERVFNIDGQCRLAAQSVDQSPDDIIDLEKLAEGGFNRTFLITMLDGFQTAARIPYYPATVPEYYAVASEVNTMALLRSSGLPIHKLCGYLPAPDNAAETKNIFMEFVRGTKLSDVWLVRWRPPYRRRKSWRIGPWTTWTKRNTCDELN